MKTINIKVGFLILLFLPFMASASYIKDYPVTVTQPDGIVLNCFVTGDEFYNWLHDANKYTIIRNTQTGYYCYAVIDNDELIASPYIVGNTDPSSVGLQPGANISSQKMLLKRKSIMESTPFMNNKSSGLIKSIDTITNIGTINNIVIFIRFAGENEFTDNVNYFDNLFNNTPGQNSMRNYFEAVSYNQLHIVSSFYSTSGTTVISYQDANTRNYYEPYDAATNPNGYTDKATTEHNLLKNAINAVKTQIPAGLNIDYNNDGYVDNICFVISGDVTAWSTLLWPHCWSLYSQTATINGKQVWDYNIQLRDYFNLHGVGVLCHEMFHTLGAPDLYHYSQNGFIPVGFWDLMENETNPPQSMGAYMKKKYGNWVDSIPVISPGTYSLKPLASPVNNCYKIIAPCASNEFFVLEYRKKEGLFENLIPASGLLIYRIKPDLNGNINGPPDEVYIYRPGGTITNNGSVNSANFSADEGRTKFNLSTDPKCFLSDGTECGLNIHNISEAGDSITFTYGPICVAPVFLSAYYITEYSAVLGWSSTANKWQIEYGLHDFTQGTGTQIITTNNPYILSGLAPSTTYDYYIRNICDIDDTSAWAGPYTFSTLAILEITKFEYFLDTDPGLDNGIQVTVLPGTDVSVDFHIPFDSVSEGFHDLYIRSMDSYNKWSLCQIMPFYCLQYRPTPDIVRMEYFLDNDPGLGNGTSLGVAQDTNVTSLFNITLAGVAKGFHILYIRALDSYDKWSLTNTIPFYNTTITNTDVTKLEYFIDSDPGFDNGTNVNITPSSNITKNMNIPLTGISDGFHVLYLRVKDNQNKWSLTQIQSFYKVSLQDEKVCKLEYYIDSDPGFGNGVPVDITPSAANISKLFYVDLACVPVGNHVIYLRAMDTYNKWSLINTKSFTVNQSPVVISYIGSTNLCPGDSVILKAPSGSGITYQWKQNETNINGATDSIYIAKTSGSYKVIMHHSEYNTCNDSSSTITITVTPLPAVAGTISGTATVCPGQNSVTYSVPDIIDATSYIWTIPFGATGTSTTNSITLNYGMTADSGNITVKGHNSCGDGVSSTLAISVNGHNISGKTCYAGKAHAGNPAPNLPTYNSEIYYIDNVIVLLKDQSMGFEVARDTSNSIGDYQLRCITDGNYFISYHKYTSDTMQWGNQVTAVDLALLQYYIGHICQTDPSRCFSDKHLRAANVDNNASLTSVDVARISAKIGSPYSPAKNFPKGNWVAFDTSVTVAGANLNITLKTICYGDYDASSYKYKDSTTTWDMAKSLPDENIIIRSDESITINDNEYFEVPLRISTKMNELSAVNLELNYPSDKYKLVSASMSNNGKKSDAIKINPTLEEIIAANNDLLVTDDRGIIRVVFATTDHFDVAANDELIRLGFRTLIIPGKGELDFNLNGTGLIANQYGVINEDAYLTMPKIFVQGSDKEAGFEFAGYPNPFSSEATLTYNIPEDGIVKLNVYNAIGELVTELLNETQVSGRHSVVFSTGNLSESLYTFKLEFTGWDNSKCMILKLIH